MSRRVGSPTARRTSGQWLWLCAMTAAEYAAYIDERQQPAREHREAILRRCERGMRPNAQSEGAPVGAVTKFHEHLVWPGDGLVLSRCIAFSSATARRVHSQLLSVFFDELDDER